MGNREILLKKGPAEAVPGLIRRRIVAVALSGVIVCLTSCSSSNTGNAICSAGQTIPCACGGEMTGVRYCSADLTRYDSCICLTDPLTSDAAFDLYVSDSSTYVAGNSSTGGVGGGDGISGGGGLSWRTVDASTAGSSGTSTAGSSSQTPVDSSVTALIDSGGANDGATTTTPPVVDSGTTTPPTDDLEAARQFCVGFINEKRASVGLPPLQRATPEQEACTDQGSQSDSVTYYATHVAHSSAGQCLGGAQNTCPCLPIGAGRPTLIDALRECLTNMWNEGMPPQGREACEADRTGCFMQYGHYLNMTRENTTTVSCGFYRLPQDVSECINFGATEGWWSNQDFDMQWR